MNPFSLKPDYAPVLPAEELRALGVERSESGFREKGFIATKASWGVWTLWKHSKLPPPPPRYRADCHPEAGGHY